MAAAPAPAPAAAGGAAGGARAAGEVPGGRAAQRAETQGGQQGRFAVPPPLRAGVAPSWPLASGNLPALGRGQSPPQTPSWRDPPAWRGKGDPTPAPPAAGARGDASPGRGGVPGGGVLGLLQGLVGPLGPPLPSSTDKPGGSQRAPYPPPHAGISEGGERMGQGAGTGGSRHRCRRKAKVAPSAPTPTPGLDGVSPAERLSSPVRSLQNRYGYQAEPGTPTPRIPALSSPRVCQVDV